MTETILKFNLDNEVEQEKFRLASDGYKYDCFVHEFYQEYLRAYDKHGVPERFKTVDELIAHLREVYIERLIDHGLQM